MNDRYYKYPGKRQGKVAAAIWPWKCKDALLRYNDVADTKLNQDGMAYEDRKSTRLNSSHPK